MAKVRLIAILFCLSLLATAVPVTAQQATMRGVVQDAAGASIPGVLVVVERGFVTHEAVSDSQGTFSFPRLPAGTLRVSASLTGFQPFRENVVLRDGDAHYEDVFEKHFARLHAIHRRQEAWQHALTSRSCGASDDGTRTRALLRSDLQRDRAIERLADLAGE